MTCPPSSSNSIRGDHTHRGGAGGVGGGAGVAGASVCRKRWRAPSQERLWRVASAEAFGSALLVLFSCVPACTDPPLELLQRALAAGLVVALLVQCLDHISGAQLNPTVTLAAALWGRMSWTRAWAMCAAQAAGATCGAALLTAILPTRAPAGCMTLPAPGFSPWRALLLEGALSGCLALANCSSWDTRNMHLRDSWPLRIGASVAAMSLVASSLTGASMNPTRSFGPALLAGHWNHHWVYWLGPLGGSALCTGLYCWAWRHDTPTLRASFTSPRDRLHEVLAVGDGSSDARADIVKSHHSI